MAAEFLTARAAAHDVTVLRRRQDELLVVLRLRRPGGRVVVFTLIVDAGIPEPRVREQVPQHLPSFCPERHVNDGGWFCMSFQDADPLRVTDADSADAWWSRVWKYLSLQITAGRLRRWPNARAWAHGDAAAYQRRAEACAAALKLGEALGEGRLKVVRSPGRSTFVALHDEHRKLYSVWAPQRRTATLRQACICGSGRALRDCGDHAALTAELVFALEAWPQAEDAFWRTFSHRPCCQSFDVCPLKTAELITPPAGNDQNTAQAA